jgi:hypothetical protein
MPWLTRLKNFLQAILHTTMGWHDAMSTCTAASVLCRVCGSEPVARHLHRPELDDAVERRRSRNRSIRVM